MDGQVTWVSIQKRTLDTLTILFSIYYHRKIRQTLANVGILIS